MPGHGSQLRIPGTTQVYRDALGGGYPLRVAVGKLGKLTGETDLLVDQIRPISHQRLMGDKALAELSFAHMRRAMGPARHTPPR